MRNDRNPRRQPATTRLHKCLPAAMVAGVLAAAPASAVEWSNTAGGPWSVPTNWTPTDVPDTTGEDASINAAGTYQVDWDISGGGNAINDVTIGTTSGSGIQTLRTAAFAGHQFNNMTIGPNGVFLHQTNIGGGDVGESITVQSGGQYVRNGNTAFRDTGGHDLIVDTGGLVDIQEGTLGISTFRNLVLNGMIDGPGTLSGDRNGIEYFGTGTIGGTGLFQIAIRNPNTNRLDTRAPVFHDSLVIDRDVRNDANLYVADGAVLTINGTYTQKEGSRSIGPELNGNTAMIDGSGDIFIESNFDDGSDMRFGGANPSNNGGGTTQFKGTGTLNFVLNDGDDIQVTAGMLDLQRNTTISGDPTQSGQWVLIGNSDDVTVKLSGAGNSLTLGEGARVFAENRFFMNKRIVVDGDGELAMAGGTMSVATSNSEPNDQELQVGVSSAGLMSLTAGTTSRLQTVGDSNDKGNFRVRLGPNASTAAGAGATLELASVDFQIDITNGDDWGWDEAGALIFEDVATGNDNIDRDGVFEALSTDLGNMLNIDNVDFAINMLGFADGTRSLTLADGTDNDGDGIADTALYVRTLDFSALSGGGFDVLGLNDSGRIYYQFLQNPNGVQLDPTVFQQLPPPPSDEQPAPAVPEPAGLLLTLLGGGALLGRRPR